MYFAACCARSIAAVRCRSSSSCHCAKGTLRPARDAAGRRHAPEYQSRPTAPRRARPGHAAGPPWSDRRPGGSTLAVGGAVRAATTTLAPACASPLAMAQAPEPPVTRRAALPDQTAVWWVPCGAYPSWSRLSGPDAATVHRAGRPPAPDAAGELARRNPPSADKTARPRCDIVATRRVDLIIAPRQVKLFRCLSAGTVHGKHAAGGRRQRPHGRYHG